MSQPKMHADELDIDVEVVGRLVASQLPQWAGLASEPVFPRGTDNALFRLGDELVIRLPRRELNVEGLEKERLWLPRLAPALPLPIPEPVAEGVAGEGYPFGWSVYRWLDGRPATRENVRDPVEFARDLAQFVRALERIDPSGGPTPGAHNSGRGVPLERRDRATRAAIAALTDRFDKAALNRAWAESLNAPEWTGGPVWLHGDLDARNLLVDDDGRLSGVLDFGCLGLGDPACDVAAAWKLVDGESRDAFRAELDTDDATWERSRGWVLSQAVMILSYYTFETNAVLVDEAERWLAALHPSE